MQNPTARYKRSDAGYIPFLPLASGLGDSRTSHLPKQQLPADRSVFLIRLLQLRMVHAVVIRPHGPHWLKPSFSGKGDRKDEEETRGGDGNHGGVKTSKICAGKKGRYSRSKKKQ